MAVLSVHAVQWCAQHGHPVLALRTVDDRYFVVALSAEDGAALAVLPDANEAEKPSSRLYRLLEATLRAVGSRLTEVHLHVGSDHLLRASLRLRSPGGEVDLPAHFADGIVLAHRGSLPLRMADEDLTRVPLAPLIPVESCGAGDAATVTPPEAFRSLIESLDLDGLGPRHRDRGSQPPEARA